MGILTNAVIGSSISLEKQINEFNLDYDLLGNEIYTYLPFLLSSIIVRNSELSNDYDELNQDVVEYELNIVNLVSYYDENYYVFLGKAYKEYADLLFIDSSTIITDTNFYETVIYPTLIKLNNNTEIHNLVNAIINECLHDKADGLKLNLDTWTKLLVSLISSIVETQDGKARVIISSDDI